MSNRATAFRLLDLIWGVVDPGQEAESHGLPRLGGRCCGGVAALSGRPPAKKTVCRRGLSGERRQPSRLQYCQSGCFFLAVSDEPASESKNKAKERRRYEEHRLYVFLYTPDYAKTPPKEWPFACVVALRNDEKVINNQWCCLHVFVRRDGTFDFAEGMFATETEVTELYGPVLWPEIAKALAVTPQAYRAAFGTKSVFI